MKHDCNPFTCPACARALIVDALDYMITIRDRMEHEAARPCLALERGMTPPDPCPCLPCFARRQLARVREGAS